LACTHPAAHRLVVSEHDSRLRATARSRPRWRLERPYHRGGSAL